MERVRTLQRKRIFIISMILTGLLIILCVRVAYLMIMKADFLQEKAEILHHRERVIQSQRGLILDRNGTVLAMNQSVNRILVIHNQITEPDKVIDLLSEKLNLDYDFVEKKVNKNVALELIKNNVEKSIGDEIRSAGLSGIIIDEDYRRIYPYDNVASNVLGFVGGDHQGIIGLEVKYDKILKGENGLILTETNARGIEIDGAKEKRVEPVNGINLVTSLDINIQQYAQQALEKVLISKGSNKGAIIVMNPQNGEIYAMVNKPDFNLNDPFAVPISGLTDEEENVYLNQLWRNYCINDTYEPGSTFKMVTTATGLQEGVVGLEDTFYCKGYYTVADRMIRCHKYGGHGSETFLQGVQNSCNPVFMAVAERVGASKFYAYMKGFGLMEKTGVDLPGEAVGIMHKLDNIGPVELATMSFGQSFQITPMQLIRAGAAVVNGGTLVTPHFAIGTTDSDGNWLTKFQYDTKQAPISEETSETVRMILESVVSVGTGRNCYIEGYKIGGKTATSEKLPRSKNLYISSFMGFAPADHPSIMILVIVDEPQGIYYGGTVAAPVARDIFENILPYMGYEPVINEVE